MKRHKALVTLYTRPGCHLCEEAKEQMFAAECTDLYEFEEINIETDPALVERYGMKIPVITINGADVFMFRLTAEQFRDALFDMTPD